MEENKILEFVKEFNARLENSNEYNSIQYQNDGYQEGLLIPNIYLWSDDEGLEYFRQRALSSLVRQLDLLQEVGSELLADEIDKFFAGKKKDLKEKFPDAKLKCSRIAICRYKITVFGKYSEDIMEQFGEGLREDFEYVFHGFKLDVEY